LPGNSDRAAHENRKQNKRQQEEDKDPRHPLYIGLEGGWLYTVGDKGNRGVGAGDVAT